MWCSRGCLEPHAISDAWLCHVTIAGGSRRRGCAAAGVSVFLDGPLAREALALDLGQRARPTRLDVPGPQHRRGGGGERAVRQPDLLLERHAGGAAARPAGTRIPPRSLTWERPSRATRLTTPPSRSASRTSCR